MRCQNTPLLPGFPVRFGRPRIPFSQKLARHLLSRRSLNAFHELFSSWISASDFTVCENKTRRKRIFSTETTFWAFLYQILMGTGCRGAVKQVQSWMIHRGQPVPSSNPSAYAQSRNRLPQAVLSGIFSKVSSRIEKRVPKKNLWNGRRVKVVDGTKLSAPDTEENQGKWPQGSQVKPGCSFPELKVVGVFCLFSGTLLAWKGGGRRDGEMTLWRKLWDVLNPGDVVLGDRAYGSYACLAGLARRGIDGVYKLHASRKINWKEGVKIGVGDSVFTWNRSGRRGMNWTREQWAQLPENLLVRIVKRNIDIPGFRTTKVVIATTLLDSKQYSADDLVELYRRRWMVELFFRDVKTTLGMERLKGKTPESVIKELTMYLICYNLLRGIIQEAGKQENILPERISFKGAAQQLGSWLWLFMNAEMKQAKRRELIRDFYSELTRAPVPDRPGRSEPRVIKTRPKNYQFMTRPRHADRELKSA